MEIGEIVYMAGKCAILMDDGNCKVKVSQTNGTAPVLGKRPDDEPIVISASVGQGGANKKDDVFKIQYGLDQVPPVDGGPSTPLKVDGLCGPKTIAAIREFQKKHFGWAGCDGRIDPGKQTLAMLNAKRQTWIKPYLPLDLAADGWLLSNLLRHIPHTRSCVQAAMTKISSARMGGLFADGSMSLINRHFHLQTSKNQQGDLALMYDVYSFMLNVLDRADAYITLDTNDEGEGISTVAIARTGGFHNKTDLTGKIQLRRGAYFASETPDFAAFVFIHEMRHYVERNVLCEGHFAKGWYSDKEISELPPDLTVLNCDTYAGFALESRNGNMQRPGWLKSTKFR